MPRSDHGETRFLMRLALAAASTRDAGELVRLVIAETTEAMGTDVCSVYLLQAGERELLLTATNGLSQAGVGRTRLRVGEGVTGWAAAERRPVVVDDVRAEPRFRWLPGVDQARFVSMCSVPIVSGDRLVGVVNVQTDVPRRFGTPDVELLAAIAAHVAGALERAELQARLEARVADLRRSERTHRRLSGLALSGAGLQAICAAVAEMAGTPVAVYDVGAERVAASPDAGALPARLNGDQAGVTVLTARAGADRLGALAAATARPDPACAETLEHGVTVIALELMRARAEAETERRLRGDLVEELLGAALAPADAERLAARATRLGHRIGGSAWVLALEPDDDDAARALAAGGARARLARALTERVGLLSDGGLVVERGAGLALLVPEGPSAARVEELAGAGVELARALAGASLSAGISSRPGGPADLHLLAEEARQALAVGRRGGRRAAVVSHGRLGVERLLLGIERPLALAGYVEEWVGPLVRHGASGSAAAPLLETLEALVAEGWNNRAASRRLHVHVNTLLYRMGRIEALCGRPLDDPDARLGLALALRARALVPDMDSSPHPPHPRPDGSHEPGANGSRMVRP